MAIGIGVQGKTLTVDASLRNASVGEAIEVFEGALDVVEGVIGLVLLDDEPVDAG